MTGRSECRYKYLNYMSSMGITTLWDAGNFNMDDAVYRAAHAIAKDGDLPLRWEGSYHIWAPEQIDTAAQSLLRLREEYGHGKLRFNTVKILSALVRAAPSFGPGNLQVGRLSSHTQVETTPRYAHPEKDTLREHCGRHPCWLRRRAGFSLIG